MMQWMTMDGGRPNAENGLRMIGEAIKEALEGRSQGWLAKELGLDASGITRLVKGTMKDLTVERVADIEAVLGLPRGALLCRAGYVADVLSPEDAIRQDVSIPRSVREAVIAAIQSSRGGRHR